MGIAGSLPPSDLSVTGPSTLLMLGRGSPPIPNRAVGAHMGVAGPLSPSDLSVTEPSTLLMLGRGSPPVPNKAVGADRKSTRLNSSHSGESRMPSSA